MKNYKYKIITIIALMLFNVNTFGMGKDIDKVLPTITKSTIYIPKNIQSQYAKNKDKSLQRQNEKELTNKEFDEAWDERIEHIN